MSSFIDDPLLPQKQVKIMFGDPSDMTMWRHRQRGILPDPVKINGRNYWRRSVAEHAVAAAIGGSVEYIKRLVSTSPIAKEG